MTTHHGSKAGAPQAVSRIGLYAPTGVLIAGALAWSGFWLYAARSAEAKLRDWVKTEAAEGRTWTCGDQTIGGFPFRIELKCSSASLLSDQEGTTLRLHTGSLHAVTQIYSPKLVLTDISGPLTIQSGALDMSASWEALRISVRLGHGVERVSLAASLPRITLPANDGEKVTSDFKALELHARTDGERLAADNAVEVAVRVASATIPAADALTGSSEKIDLELSGAVTKASSLPLKHWRSMLEDWRTSAGRFVLERGRLAKGRLRMEGNGILRLDAARRLSGELEVGASGLGPLISRLGGGGMSQLVTPLLEKSDGRATKWPVRLQDGRIQMGPFRSGPVMGPLY